MGNSDIYVATESFATTLDGESVSIQKDRTRVRVGHILLKRHPEFFAPLTVHYDVEQATSRPGEQRGAPAPAAPAPEPEPVPAPEPEPVKAPEPEAKAKPGKSADSK